MKRKVGTLVEDDIFKLAKRRAAEEGRSLSDLIQDALVSYLDGRLPDPKEREKAYRIFCEQPIRINQKQLKEIMEEDTWSL